MLWVKDNIINRALFLKWIVIAVRNICFKTDGLLLGKNYFLTVQDELQCAGLNQDIFFYTIIVADSYCSHRQPFSRGEAFVSS